MLHSASSVREDMFSGQSAAIPWPVTTRASRTPDPESRMPQGGALMIDAANDDYVEHHGGNADRLDYARLAAPIWYPDSDVLTPQMRHGLSWTIEAAIIPRLLQAHRSARDAFDAKPQSRPLEALSYADVEAFCELVVRHPTPSARQYLDRLIEQGMSVEGVITTVLCSAARHLGLLWDGDRLSFIDVTVGLSRIQQLLRSYGPAFHGQAVQKGPGHRILLAMVPGDQHTFGLSVVEEYFIRAGWAVENEGASTRQAILDLAHTQWFDAIGFSANSESSEEDIAALIALVRDAALNRHIHVVVGGYRFFDNPERAVALGADFGARDATEALTLFERDDKRKLISP